MLFGIYLAAILHRDHLEQSAYGYAAFDGRKASRPFVGALRLELDDAAGRAAGASAGVAHHTGEVVLPVILVYAREKHAGTPSATAATAEQTAGRIDSLFTFSILSN